jgi:hypothetical protein
MVEDVKPGDVKLGNWVAKKTYIYTMILTVAFIATVFIFIL